MNKITKLNYLDSEKSYISETSIPFFLMCMLTVYAFYLQVPLLSVCVNIYLSIYIYLLCVCLESYTQIYLHVLTAIYTPYVIWKGEKGITKMYSYLHQSSSQLCILNECLMLFKILFYKQYEQQILIIAISSVYIPTNLCNTYLPPLDSARCKPFFFFLNNHGHYSTAGAGHQLKVCI